MCQTSLISSNIVRLSTRSYRQRLEAVTPGGYSVSRLARLNKDLDDFYELLYDQWQTVTEKDYKILGPQLNIMLTTLKELLAAYKKHSKEPGLYKDVEKLSMNYSAIHEVNSDIVNFKIKIPQDTEVKELIDRASKVAKQTVL